MKDLLAFLFPFLGALGGLVSTMKPKTANDWLIGIVIALGVGATGTLAKASNKAIDKSQGN